jgi:hypothetical protein
VWPSNGRARVLPRTPRPVVAPRRPAVRPTSDPSVWVQTPRHPPPSAAPNGRRRLVGDRAGSTHLRCLPAATGRLGAAGATTAPASRSSPSTPGRGMRDPVGAECRAAASPICRGRSRRRRTAGGGGGRRHGLERRNGKPMRDECSGPVVSAGSRTLRSCAKLGASLADSGQCPTSRPSPASLGSDRRALVRQEYQTAAAC